MQHLQPGTLLQGGKYRNLRVSECPKNSFLIGRVGADYSIERVMGQGKFGNSKKMIIFATIWQKN